MTLLELFQQAFNNTSCFDKFKEALTLDNLQINTVGSGLEISFVKENKLETLLVQPQQIQVGPTHRRTKMGVQHVKGHKRATPQPNIEDLIQAQESDTALVEQINTAIQEYIECCLESIDRKKITLTE